MAAGLVLLIKSTEKTTHKFLLPKGFTGWIEVTYEQPGSPPLKKEGDTLIYEVPFSGKVRTSSKNVSGPMVLFDVEQDGQQVKVRTDVPMIHDQGTSGGEQLGADGIREIFPEKLIFFVGTEEQWREAKNKRP